MSSESGNRLGITDGPFGWGLDVRFCDDRFKHSVSFGNGRTIILLHQADWPVDDDVKRFIADAFNIFSRTGKRPSELEAELAELKRQRDELRELLIEMRDAVKEVPAMNHMKYDALGSRVNKALANTKEKP